MRHNCFMAFGKAIKHLVLDKSMQEKNVIDMDAVKSKQTSYLLHNLSHLFRLYDILGQLVDILCSCQKQDGLFRSFWDEKFQQKSRNQLEHQILI